MMRKLLTMIIWMVIGTGICAAQTTAFTYQGKLNDGGIAANGNYDFEFRLFDTPTTGSGTQVGATVTHSNIAVANGIFSVELDFGSTAFTTTLQRYLEIRVRPAGNPDPLTTLSPRQKITSSPTAIRSVQAADLNCVGCVSDNEITTISGAKVSGAVSTAINAVSADGANFAAAANTALSANTVSPGAGAGIVNIQTFSGSIGTISPSASVWAFVGTPTNVTATASSNQVTGSASAVLATSVGVTSIDVNLCYQTTGNPTVNPSPTSSLTVSPTTNRSIFSYSGHVALPVGTHSVGMCVRNFGANALDNNHNLSGWVMVPK